MPQPCEITPTQLARLIGRPDAPRLLDMRIADDFASDPHLVPGSIRADWQDPTAYLGLARGHRCVVICQKGQKISHGVAALLRAEGVAAEVLEGGQFAWRDAGLPLIDTTALPPTRTWVTRARPKIDRIACAWLLHRFIDPGARVMFVPPTHVAAVAERFGAEPIDMPGARFGHHGDLCSFDALLGLVIAPPPALRKLADILRACDTGRPQDDAQAAGVTAILLGLSRLHRDDHDQLGAAMPVLDALYLWARDARDETHADPAP
ncbi:chromate resistance protein [Maribius pontilimi]|uniref:Chromate resistance protein n=1 Tax=Palleronia pontilimi TaxID=1964209 RepID=A0A934MFF7_9RHOB|nr:chromate resistance protein ChrB domain-containing protein [Palleronia pontilimi]MBJ3761419.1 chromate resistance protein [Palleronia pontilimi]